MEATTDTAGSKREAIVVNRNLEIEISFEEILEDLLFPESRAASAR